MTNLLTVVGLIALVLFVGGLSLAVGAGDRLRFGMVVLVAVLLTMGWRRRRGSSRAVAWGRHAEAAFEEGAEELLEDTEMAQ